MTMRRLGDLKWNRAAGDPPHGALLLTSLAAVLLVGPPGCGNPPGSAVGTVEIGLVPGETANGNLFSGQTLRATASVKAGHVYDLIANLTLIVGATGPADMEGLVSGAPLSQPVEFSVGSSGDESLGSEQRNTLVAHLDGEAAIEFVFPSTDETDSVGGTLESIRRLIIGPSRATYELLLTDLGFDDNGTSPETAAALVVGPEGELPGTLSAGDEADYFVLQVEADTDYQLTLEATDSVNLTSGSEDRFGQLNFGAVTVGGLLISGSASAGTPGTSQFAAPATEDVLLRLAATVSDFDTSLPPIEYAISVVEAVPEGE